MSVVIFNTGAGGLGRHAALAATVTFPLVSLACLAGPSLWSFLVSPVGAISTEDRAGLHIQTILTAALAASGYIFVLLKLPTQWQMRLVWLSLAALFGVFFLSFDLSFTSIAAKLPYLLSVGAVTTLYISALSIAIAFCLALAGAIAKLSGNGIAMGIGSFYTSYFRGVPLLVQLFVIYTGLPQIGYVINPIPAGIAALSLCYGAYMTEIFRAGIASIARGQWEAADALGLRRGQTFRLVILPQTMRLIVPPTGNQFIAMLKDSSLISVVGVWDLMFVARAQGRSDFKTLEMLITASIIYWIMSITLELVQSRIEQRFRQMDHTSASRRPAE